MLYWSAGGGTEFSFMSACLFLRRVATSSLLLLGIMSFRGVAASGVNADIVREVAVASTLACPVRARIAANAGNVGPRVADL